MLSQKIGRKISETLFYLLKKEDMKKRGDKDYTKSEKQLLVSLINDYSLFGATDSENIQMLSQKIGRKISETLFYLLKKEDMKKRGDKHYKKAENQLLVSLNNDYSLYGA